MHVLIASQHLSISCPPALESCINALKPYEVSDDLPADAVQIDLMRFRFPEKMIPEHRDDYSGFLTHTSVDPNRAAFIFCFREGVLLYGMQKEQDNTYHVYIHKQASIGCRTAIQYILLLEGCKINYLGIHSVTVEDNGRGILFSAPSGTGKTTHTELWRKEFGSTILNGDFAMLKCEDQSITFDGTPFCGSSPYAERGQWPITDIVFLRQAPDNRIRRLSRIESITHAMENCFVPKWNKEETQLCMNLMSTLLKNVRTWRLECNMDPEAAHVARDAIAACTNTH